MGTGIPFRCQFLFEWESHSHRDLDCGSTKDICRKKHCCTPCQASTSNSHEMVQNCSRVHNTVLHWGCTTQQRGPSLGLHNTTTRSFTGAAQHNNTVLHWGCTTQQHGPSLGLPNTTTRSFTGASQHNNTVLHWGCTTQQPLQTCTWHYKASTPQTVKLSWKLGKLYWGALSRVGNIYEKLSGGLWENCPGNVWGTMSWGFSGGKKECLWGMSVGLLGERGGGTNAPSAGTD